MKMLPFGRLIVTNATVKETRRTPKSSTEIPGLVVAQEYIAMAVERNTTCHADSATNLNSTAINPEYHMRSLALAWQQPLDEPQQDSLQ